MCKIQTNMCNYKKTFAHSAFVQYYEQYFVQYFALQCTIFTQLNLKHR